MKKIVGAVLAATLAAGVATAEVTVKLDSATKMDAFNFLDNGTTTKYGEFSIFTENKFTLDAKNDAGTVGVSMTPRFNSETKTKAYTSSAATPAGTTVTEMKADGLFHRIEWNAFVKGKYAKATVGNFESRNANRVTTDAGKYHVWELAKLGYSKFSAPDVKINGKLGYSQVETDYIARAGNTNINAVGDLYVGPVTVQMAYRQGASSGDPTEDVKYFAGNWAMRVFGNIKDYVKLTATLTGEDAYDSKAFGADQTVRNTKLDLGIFAEISALKKVGTFLVGYSGGYSIYDGTAVVTGLKADTSVHAINTRIRIPLVDNKLGITTHNDFSFGTKVVGTDDKTVFSMLNIVSVTYKVNSIFTPQIYFANNYLSCDGDTYGALIIAPRCQFSLAKGANFYASLEYRKSYTNVDGTKEQSSLQIPMVLHVAL